MASLKRSAVTLRVMGDELVPTNISNLLGCLPTSSYRKGEERVGKISGQKSLARFGNWGLRVSLREPENIDGQIAELLGRLTDDFEVWKTVSRDYSVSLICGLFMGSWNDGATISVASLTAMASRGIRLELDIYGSADGEATNNLSEDAGSH